jgi:hypothetical protein
MGMGVRIILKWILGVGSVRIWAGFNWLSTGRLF